MHSEDDALVARVREQTLHRGDSAEPPATDADIEASQRSLDAPLPPLLRRLFLEVANGGFGPEEGIPGVRNGFRGSTLGTLDEGYRMFREYEPWPRGLVPIVDVGCAQFICLATIDFAGALAINDDAAQLWRTDFTLEWLLSAWCDDREIWSEMNESAGWIEREGINPFTKKPHVFRQPKFRALGTPWPGYVPPE